MSGLIGSMGKLWVVKGREKEEVEVKRREIFGEIKIIRFRSIQIITVLAFKKRRLISQYHNYNSPLLCHSSHVLSLFLFYFFFLTLISLN